MISEARQRTWLRTSEKSFLWLGAPERLPGCELSKGHAGNWLAEQTTLGSLHPGALRAISGIAKQSDKKQGRVGAVIGGWGCGGCVWAPPCDLPALTWGLGRRRESQRSLGTFSKLEVVQRKLLNKNQVSLTE